MWVLNGALYVLFSWLCLCLTSGSNPNCYTECICAAIKQATQDTSGEWASIMKASGVTSFATQLAACVQWATDNIEPTLPQWVQDHLKQTKCPKPDKCPQ